jgi:hypothetical protein
MISISQKLKIIFLIEILFVLNISQTESKYYKQYVYYYYDYPNNYVDDYNYGNYYIYDTIHPNYKTSYYGKTPLKKNYYYDNYYPKCSFTRSKCWSDSECCSLECVKYIDNLPGVCGRDE